MRRMMGCWLLMAGWPVAAQPIKPDDPLPPGRLVPLPEAVVKRVTRPEVVTRHDPIFPDAARAAGHHGVVIVDVTVDSSGQIVDASVKRSSRSPLLDQAAIDAVRQWSFKPGRSLDGGPGSGTIELTFNFDDRVLADYRCSQAVRDLDWWRHQWSGAPDPLVESLRPRDDDFTRYLKAQTKFNKALGKTLARCAETPDATFVAVLAQNGVDVQAPRVIMR